MSPPFLYPSPTVPILPTLNGFSVHKKPIWASTVEETVSGREVMYATAAWPLWEFELTYEVLRSQTQNIVIDSHESPFLEFEQIASIFLVCAGQYGRFYYNDVTDNSRTAQPIGTGDGTTTNFTMYRTFGTNPLAITEPVGSVNNDIPVTVFLDGVVLPQPGNWGFVDANQTLVFTSPPGAGVVISATFYFYYLCRFIEDVKDFEQFMHNLWTVKSFKFRSVKD